MLGSGVVPVGGGVAGSVNAPVPSPFSAPGASGSPGAVFGLKTSGIEPGPLESAPLWESLRGRFDDRQLLELIATAGWYRLISYVCNGLGVEREDWALRFADAA